MERAARKAACEEEVAHEELKKLDDLVNIDVLAKLVCCNISVVHERIHVQVVASNFGQWS
jgi:hypothetical protein